MRSNINDLHLERMSFQNEVCVTILTIIYVDDYVDDYSESYRRSLVARA